MRRRLSIMIIAAALVALNAAPVFSQSSLSTYIGGAFYRYEESFLLTGVTFLSTPREQMELNLAADFGISTVEIGGEISPQFYIPLNVGINFTFSGDPIQFYFGPGLSPVFLIQPGADDPFTFLVGPYAKAGVRIQVHSIMKIFVEVQQDLLVGGPQWVNTATKVLAGITFSLSP